MYSSRMCTARALIIGGKEGVYLSLGVCVPARGVYLPRVCTFRGSVPAGRGVPAWGCVPVGGVPALRGVPAQVLPPVNRMTDRYKNITLPQTSFAGAN